MCVHSRVCEGVLVLAVGEDGGRRGRQGDLDQKKGRVEAFLLIILGHNTRLFFLTNHGKLVAEVMMTTIA